MPDRTKLTYVVGSTQDLRSVRIPGAQKPFEQMTISELVQLRPGSGVEDNYEVNAVTDNASVTTSSLLNELGKVASRQAVNRELVATRLRGAGGVEVIRKLPG
ncbi:MAG: hypothetical protein IT176_14010 [Acidobacteria bacterium]|nr:hypothetical protein [Acidobacteriota bacterium]